MFEAVDPFHLGSLFALRAMLARDDQSTPTITPLGLTGPCGSVAILPGSFNPPTAAHLLLAERARAEGFERVMFLLARETVGKKWTGMLLEDRLLALRSMAEASSGVGLCTHGLYVDQATAAQALFPGADIALLVGSDKVLQIFEHSWYPDREESLERLFSAASLIVAPRSDQTETLKQVLNEPSNRRYAERVSILRLHPAVGELSSTRVRGLLRAGADPAGLVPAAIAPILSETRAFAAPMVIEGEECDAYDIRVRLLDLIWRTRGESGADVDLRRLTSIALSATPPGRRLRAMLSDETACADDLSRAMASGL